MARLWETLFWQSSDKDDWESQSTQNEWLSFNHTRTETYVLSILWSPIFLIGSAITAWSCILGLWCYGHVMLGDRRHVWKKVWNLWHHPVTLILIASVTAAAVAQSRSPFAILSYAWIALPVWYSWWERGLRPERGFASPTPGPAESR